MSLLFCFCLLFPCRNCIITWLLFKGEVTQTFFVSWCENFRSEREDLKNLKIFFCFYVNSGFFFWQELINNDWRRSKVFEMAGMASYSFCFYVNSGFFFWHDFPLDRRKREIGLFRACDGVKKGKRCFLLHKTSMCFGARLWFIASQNKKKILLLLIGSWQHFPHKCYYSVLITATVQQLLQKYSKSGGKSITTVIFIYMNLYDRLQLFLVFHQRSVGCWLLLFNYT